MGHPAIGALLDGPVVVEEKVDGSQFSFGLFGDELKLRSRGRVFSVHDADNLFHAAVATVLELRDRLHEGWTYRGEYLRTPRHNTLAYGRVPAKHIILFDINVGNEKYVDRRGLEEEAGLLGLEPVPVLYTGPLTDVEVLRDLLALPSVLGGEIEGVVVKNHHRFGADGKALMGKYVREDFKERNDKAWKQANPKKGDVVQQLCEAYRTEARWEKAVQHLRDRGELGSSPQDIASLIREVHRDIDEECKQEIADVLYRWAAKQIKRSATRGLPEWYKGRLLDRQFGGGEQ